jgi:hypothetical protein
MTVSPTPRGPAPHPRGAGFQPARLQPTLIAPLAALLATTSLSITTQAEPTSPNSSRPDATARAATSTNTGTFLRLRGSPVDITGVITSGPGGILVRPLPAASPANNPDLPDTRPSPPAQLIAWHRVAITDLRTVDNSMALGLELMRATSRLERGDIDLAAEAIEPLYSQMTRQGTLIGPTGMVTAETVLRVRLARGMQTGATLAWLGWLDAAAEKPIRFPDDPPLSVIWVGSTLGDAPRSSGTALEPILDPTLKLCRHLPPVFGPTVPSAALAAMLASPEWGRLAAGPQRAIVRAYDAAARFELSQTIYTPDPPADGAPPTSALLADTAALVQDMVLARAGAPEAIPAARQRLRDRLDRLTRQEAARELPPTAAASDIAQEPDPRWLRAWLHAAIGRSLLRDSTPSAQREGVIELLTVPALFASDTPALAATCLLEARQALLALGEPVANVDSELRLRFPTLAPSPEADIRPSARPAAGP